MPVTKLDPQARRSIVLAALAGKRPQKEIVAEAGISRQRLHQLLGEAKRDPRAAVAEAYEEYSFACKVKTMLENSEARETR